MLMRPGFDPRLGGAYLLIGLIILAPVLSLYRTHFGSSWSHECVAHQHELLKKSTASQPENSQTRPSGEASPDTWLVEKSNCMLLEMELAAGVAIGAFALVMILWWFFSDLHELRQ